MIIYSPEKKIVLSLKDKKIAKENYADKIDRVEQFGAKKIDRAASVIIVAYIEGDDLIRNLENWKKQTVQDFEIVLVDNGLDEQIINKLKKFDILYIRTRENMGCCGGRNIGALYANADILVFGDADGYNPPNYIESALKIMRDETIVAARGKVMPIDESLLADFMPTHYDLGENRVPSIINAEGNSIWRKEDYIAVGGYDDSLAGGEGLILQYRMVEFFNYDKEAFIYDPSLVLYHDYHHNVAKLEYKIRQNAIIKEKIKRKYPFINAFIKYYADKQKYAPVKKNIHNGNMQEEIKKIHSDVEVQYRDLYLKNKERRYENAQCVKNDGTERDFSVIIPCYNLGKFLPQAIDSVLAQTLDNIEVIVVDDASPDVKTQKVLDEVSQYVTVIRLKENSGVSVARNEGIKNARSPYILCLDADDTIEPTYLEKAKNIFDSDESIGMVSCWAQYVGGDDWLWETEDKLTIENALVSTPVHTATCFRKALHNAGGGYDENLRGYEDWDHWIRIMKQDCVVRVIPEALFNYYVRPGSKVKTSNKNCVKIVRRIVNNHKELFQEHVDEVVAKKHFQWVVCDAQHKKLKKNFAQNNYQRRPRFFRDKVLGKIVDWKKRIFQKSIW